MASTDRTICTFCTTDAIAIATCTSCTEQLCELCVATHKSARMFKGHDVVTMSPSLSSVYILVFSFLVWYDLF